MNRKSNAERLAVIETELGYIKETLKEIQENHLQHIYKVLDKIGVEIHKLEESMKPRLSGKDKAIVYGAAVTALGLVVVKILEII